MYNEGFQKYKAVKKYFAVLFVVASLLFGANQIFAQQEAGQVNGVVKDSTGAVIPGASVEVKNTATNATRTITTNDDGFYEVTSLQPGAYEITARKQGFQDAKESVQVTVGGRITQNLTAGVSNITEQVTVVSAGGAEINTTDQQLSTTITGRQIQELPILNRNPYSLVGLSGNVSQADPSGRGAGYAINGLRAASTNILLDGAENNDIFSGSIGQTTPLESVAEFQVITSNFSAEYGRASGGIVNVSTRPGTNNFTGSVFAYNRNSHFSANSFDNNANRIARPFFNRNQFGYAISGPLPFFRFGEGGPEFISGKDKLFFSNSTEWTRVRSATTLFAFVPSPAFLAGANTNTQNFFAQYGTLAGTPTGVTFPTAYGNFNKIAYTAPVDAGGGTPQNTYSTVTRVDFNATDKTQMYFRYALQKPALLVGSQANSPYAGFNIGTTTTYNNFLVNVTHSFSDNFVSNTKLGYRRQTNSNVLGNAPTIPSLYFFGNTSASFSNTNIGLPGFYPYAPGAGLPTSGTEQLSQINQDMAYIRGKHTLKFGGQYVQIRSKVNFPAYQNASFTLGGNLNEALTNLYNGNIKQIQIAVNPQGQFPGGTLQLPVTAPNFQRNNRYNEGALYFNDGWRITSRVNINLGLRYEYYGVQHSIPNLDSNFYFGSGSTIQEQIRNGFAAPASTQGGLWRPDKRDFAPRLGFAWDVFGDGKTSVRGGYGIAYERNFGNVTFNVIQNPPFYSVVSATSADFGGTPIPITTNGFGPLAGSGGTKVLPRSSLRYVRNDIKTAYAHLYSAAIEHQFFKNTLVGVEYSGSAGRRLYSIENINRTGTGLRYLNSTNAAVCPASFSANTRLNCQYSNINTRGNNGYSNYNGVTLKFISNNLFNSGLAITANYTYAVSKDNLSSTFSESGNNFNLGLTDPFNPSYDYGYADFDIRHRFVSSFTYNIPTERYTSNRFARAAFGGFAITGIVTASTGSPFTIFDCTNAITTCLRLTPTAPISFKANSNPTTTAAPNSFTYVDLSNQTPSTFTDVSGGTEVGPFPTTVTRRNAFRGPGYFNFDAGFIKNIKFGERYSVQLRMELINAFNRTAFAIVGSSADLSSINPAAGVNGVQAFKQGTGPGGTPRTIQFAAKFQF